MSDRTITLTVEQSLPGWRLDTYLRDRLPAVSRGILKRLIEQQHVRVNGVAVKPTHSPVAGEVVTVYFPEARPAEALPEEIPLDVLHEDDDLLVLNKPPGLVVHPSLGHDEHTLVNALLHHCAGGLSGIGGVARPGIVHRLDKDTSGCLVVAKNDTAHLALSGQFAGRTMEKVYQAIVCGGVRNESGVITARIARHPTHRKRMATVEGGREARTTFRVRERLGSATLVEAALHTGRTHQIRVHFQHIGYPLFGDPIYGRRQTTRLGEESGVNPPRLMLHAWRLGFEHPRTGKRVTLEAPLPEDFVATQDALREAVSKSASGPGR
jgi:23S rRNA pseudouridine1911/1915/1917 synthase